MGPQDFGRLRLVKASLEQRFEWFVISLSYCTRRKIFEYIINTLGSLEKMDDQIRHLMGEMLEKNLTNAGSAADSLLRRLRRK